MNHAISEFVSDGVFLYDRDDNDIRVYGEYVRLKKEVSFIG